MFSFFTKKKKKTSKYQTLLDTLYETQERITTMELNLDALTAEVDRVSTVNATVVSVVGSLHSEVTKLTSDLEAAKAAAAPVDTSKLDALTAKLKAATDELAAAVATPTPAATPSA